EVAVNYVVGDEAAQAVVERIVAAGGKARAYKADVSDEAQVETMFAAAVADMGTVDILVANAGLQRDAAFAAMTLAQWQQVLN
ncbi:SDR family NAD(P)-dependent oxidoreductase, partial [Acinetobacter baumannii]